MLEKIAFIYTESEEQDNLFTPYHTKFNCAIKYGTHCTPFEFPYQCNTDHVMPNIKDIMECLMLDASTYDECACAKDMADELGYNYYEDTERVEYIWDECEKTSKALHAMFTDEELQKLSDEVNDF